MTITGVMDEPTGLVVSALRSLDLAIDRVRTAFAHRYRITISDSLVVSHLAANGRRLRPSEIAARILVTSGTLTPMLDRLETAGFVRREPNPDDRRSVIVALTERGDAALAEYREAFRVAIESAVPSDLRPRLADCMERLSEGLDQLAGTMESERVARRQSG
ncbi:MAG TPA: MarR family transcriptional regulator [Jatrophihabitans sp.]|jgi:DNA-binding MarR family transcriptional regulator